MILDAAVGRSPGRALVVVAAFTEQGSIHKVHKYPKIHGSCITRSGQPSFLG